MGREGAGCESWIPARTLVRFVITGLDPVIHKKGQRAPTFIMDGRVKRGHDEFGIFFDRRR
jgi:hypothetical protein